MSILKKVLLQNDTTLHKIVEVRDTTNFDKILTNELVVDLSIVAKDKARAEKILTDIMKGIKNKDDVTVEIVERRKLSRSL